MKSVNEIIQEINDRKLPEDLSTTKMYAREVFHVTRNISGVICLLIYNARQKFFGEEGKSEWLKWASESFQFDKSHIHHCRAVGELLLSVGNEVFRKLMLLSFNKLLSIKALPLEKVPEFLEEYDPEKMTRDEVREAVKKALGIKEKEEDKQRTTGHKELSKMALKVSNLSLEELQTASETISAKETFEFVKAGQMLFSVGVEAMLAKGQGNAQNLESLEFYLSTQLDEIKQNKSRMKAEEYRRAFA